MRDMRVRPKPCALNCNGVFQMRSSLSGNHEKLSFAIIFALMQKVAFGLENKAFSLFSRRK
jgi:hypothetical protein